MAFFYLMHQVVYYLKIKEFLGKGFEFEGPVPFKLIKEYIEVLDGIDSELFKTFRKLIFQ